jgi:lysophospholipase L1-like esterase
MMISNWPRLEAADRCRSKPTFLLAAALSAAILAISGDGAQASDQLQWHRIEPKDVEGQGWPDVQSPFDRLPAKAEGIVKDRVWALARHTSGLNVQFSTNAKSIWVRWTVSNERLAMSHMPATGVSGVDLYVKRGNVWLFAAAGRPSAYPTNEVRLVRGSGMRAARYRLYFPLYNGVTSLEVGVDAQATFKVEPPRTSPPIVFYGTSITQGGCASRPGMSYVAILGRRLDVPVLNLGFSGSGKAEPEVARLVAELDPAVLVLDPLGNLFPSEVSERLPHFIEVIRQSHPELPILLNENLYYPTTAIDAARENRVNDSNRRLQEILRQRQAEGDRWIEIIPASNLTLLDGDGTVDGTHPTDLGMKLMADAFEPSLRRALEHRVGGARE